MRWSKATRFALHAALELARAGGERVTTQQIAETYEISLNHLAKVMGQLVRAGIARGVRGVGGGYRLARDPARITLLEIVEAVEGPPETGCSVRDDGKPCRVPCTLRPELDEIEAYAARRLQELTLAQVAGLPPPAKTARGRRGRKLPVR
ncbi:MAG: Rrf2 family transcriptional regulator [Planctomycetes bacterium]|nr:Rrf2 family transcriptional regulator [Planctomycetota bacterium]